MSLFIKFECPSCGQSLEVAAEAAFVEIDCPTCGTKFIPQPAKSKPHPKSAEEISAAARALYAQKLHVSGDTYAVLAFVLLLAGIFIGFGTFVAGISAEDSTKNSGPSTGYAVAGGCFSLALGVYIVAQLLHIRAALSSRPGPPAITPPPSA